MMKLCWTSRVIFIFIVLADLCVAQINQSTSGPCSPVFTNVGRDVHITNLNCGLPPGAEKRIVDLLNDIAKRINSMSPSVPDYNIRTADATERMSTIISLANHYARHSDRAIKKLESIKSWMWMSDEFPDNEIATMIYALEEGKAEKAKQTIDYLYRDCDRICVIYGAMINKEEIQEIRQDIHRLVDLKNKMNQSGRQY